MQREASIGGNIMRILKVTNKVKTYALGFKNVIETLISLGHSIVWAADFSQYVNDINEIPCVIEQIPVNTNPLNRDNQKAYKQILEIIDKHEIDAVICSTPIGGALARLAAKKKHLSPVVYEAHGFLFFKGAPLINQTIYKFEEIILAHYTDALITITTEDYQAAQKLKLRSGRPPYLVHGAGVKVGVTVDIDRDKKREDIGVPDDAFLIVSVGELNKNKNTSIIIRALKRIENAHYVACGVGPEEDKLRKLAKELKVDDRFHLLGYRTDIYEILACADVFTMMSFREGMPRALLEAMDSGLPCVGSNTRGIRDLIDSEGGFICNPNDEEAFAKAFMILKDNPVLRKSMGMHNKFKAANYSDKIVRQELRAIYEEVFNVANVDSI